VKKGVFTIALCCISILVCYIFNFANQRNINKKISDVEVKIIENTRGVISEASVRKIISKNFEKDFENKIKDLNLKDIESNIKASGYVRDVEVATKVNGVLYVELTPKVPKARVLEKKDFYLDKNGYKLPLSNDLSARVPVLYNFKKNSHRDDIALILQKIEEHPFLLNNIIAIRCLKTKTYVLEFRYKDFDIFLGNTKEIDLKINNLKAFLLLLDNQKKIGEYKRINLEVTNQVIATKK